MANQAGGGVLVFGEDAAGSPEPVKSIDGGIIAFLLQLASERNPGTANQYGVAVGECDGDPVDVSVNSTDVSTVPALLFGVYINTTIAVEAVGLHDGTGGTEKATIPIGAAAGTTIPFLGLRFDTAIFVESTSATGSITPLWRAQ